MVGRENDEDVEAGLRLPGQEAEEDNVDMSDPFDVADTKNAPLETLRRWRQAALVLNATRRFRYTLNLKKDEEKKFKGCA